MIPGFGDSLEGSWKMIWAFIGEALLVWGLQRWGRISKHKALCSKSFNQLEAPEKCSGGLDISPCNTKLVCAGPTGNTAGVQGYTRRCWVECSVGN